MGAAAQNLTYHTDYKPPRDYLFKADKKDFIAPESPLQRRRRLKVLRRMWIKRARDNFSSFMQYCFIDESTGTPFKQQWFHDEWSEAMDKERRLLIIAPRDHGKTSQIVGRALYELGRDPNLRIKIVCASDGRAKERLFEIVQHLMHNRRLHEVFPNLRPAEQGEWSKHKIVVQRTARHRDASVEALGITSTATGGRADLLIADDVVDRRNALSFPALRQQIKQAWKSDWTNLLEPDSRVWYICTLWHKDDLSHQLIANPAYTKLMYAVPNDFGALWPGKWSTPALRERHDEIGSIEFNRGFRNIAVDEESATVKPEWIHFSDLREDEAFMSRLGHMVFMTSYDTAGTPSSKKANKEKQDFAAGVAIAIDEEMRKVYVLSEWTERLSVKAQALRAIADAKKYEPFKMLVEKVGQSDVDEWIINEAPELAGILETVTPRISKGQRLIGVTPLMESGQVIFDSTLDPNNRKWSPGNGSLVHQLLDFGFTKYDDLVDAFSQVLHAVRRYFLDWGATGGENLIDVTVGSDSSEGAYLL